MSLCSVLFSLQANARTTAPLAGMAGIRHGVTGGTSTATALSCVVYVVRAYGLLSKTL